MTILHLDSGREWQGGQHQLRFLVEGLRARGIRCGIKSPLWNEPVAAWDLIHCHDSKTHTFARRPFVVSRRVGFPVRPSLWTRWKYSRAADCLCVSRYVAQTMKKAGVPDSLLTIIPDGVPRMPPADRRSGRVLLLSKNGAAVPNTVPVKNLRADLADCSVFVYLSDMEGLGSAALMAQAAGVPVVASRVGGLPEAVRYGVLVDTVAEVPAAIAQARDIVVDPAAIEAEFGLDAMVGRTLAAYRRALP